MLNKTLSISLLTASLLTVAIQASKAMPSDDNKVVRNSYSNIVHAIESGTCVRTDWEAGRNPCAPAPREVSQAPAPRKLRTLESAEKAVYFDFDSAKLKPQAQNKLDEMAAVLIKADDVRSVDIVGYADRIGTDSYNVSLSKRRAETVEQYLNKRGYLNTQVVDVRGLGESKPTTNCSTKARREEQISCLSADRRVEVEIQYIDIINTSMLNQ